MRQRTGFNLTEVLLAVTLAAALLGGSFGMVVWARRAGDRGVTPQVATQILARRALVDLTRELQEASEVLRPPPGSSLGYMLVRDKLNRLVLLYTVRSGGGLELRSFTRDPSRPGASGLDRLLVTSLERVAFSSLAPGLIQVHFSVRDQSHTLPVLTAIRLRNAPAEADL